MKSNCSLFIYLRSLLHVFVAIFSLQIDAMSSNPIVSNDDIINASLKILVLTAAQDKVLNFGNLRTVYWRYVEVADRLFPVYRESTDQKLKSKLEDVIKLCISRAEVLQKTIKENQRLVMDRNIPSQIHFRVAQYYIEKAYSLDSNSRLKESLDYYIKGIGSLMSCKKHGGNINEKSLIVPLMNRAEQIKGLQAPKNADSSKLATKHTEQQQRRRTSNPPQRQRSSMSSGRSFEQSEIEVLVRTSEINGIKYLPYIHAVDRKERFYYHSTKFNDPDGKLKLSESQMKHRPSWKRPSQFLKRTPVMVQEISPFTITQSVVTDCSFVSSLIVTSNYERRFGKPLISNCIFPQNKEGVPIYNPDGKYLVKLYFNGAWRKVIIDDYFPVDGYSSWLCSHSTNENELWISIIEKAFIKINGGYNFPGSNSGIDLHNLTGWIPESHKTQKETFDRTGQWVRLCNGYRLGQCLATISTGPPSIGLDNVGLSDGHAYAVIDVRELEGGRIKLLQVKNPWRKKRWKGKYSPTDVDSWTPNLRKKLNYDILGELQFDNGVFWIDWDSVCAYFYNLHYSWNPSMFPYQSNYVSCWPLGKRTFCGTDERFVGRNPQFKLCLEEELGGGKNGGNNNYTWVMLTKHTKTIEDDQEYLSILIYPQTNGERIYRRSGESQPINKIVYTNSKHKKHCISINNNERSSSSSSRTKKYYYYTIVVSQYERIKEIEGFSINVFSRCRCRVTPLSQPQVSAFIRGKWQFSTLTAAGSVNHPETYKKNPQILMKINNNRTRTTKKIRLMLETMSKETFINMICFNNGGKKIELPTTDITIASSGKYTPGYTEILMDSVDPNILYTIVVSTYEQGVEDSFLLAVEAGEKGAVSLSFL